jgi:hypothetical protein
MEFLLGVLFGGWTVWLYMEKREKTGTSIKMQIVITFGFLAFFVAWAWFAQTMAGIACDSYIDKNAASPPYEYPMNFICYYAEI